MKRLAVVALLVLAVSLFYRSFGGAETGTGNLTLPPPEPNEDTPARNFVATDVEGERFELTDDGVYVLAFWSPLNQSSNRARPGFVRAAREYGDDVSFAVIYVNGTREDQDAPYDRLNDPTGTLASRYNVKRVPRLFVVRDGVISFVLDEYYEGYEDDLEQEIDEAITEKREEDRETALGKKPAAPTVGGEENN